MTAPPPVGGWRLVAALLALQGAIALGLGLATLGRSEPDAPFRWEALDEPAPVARFERQDGPVDATRGRVVVHFWATWCAPCLVELPGLLEAAERDGVRLIAATDEDWTVVERFFDGQVPQAVARDPDGAALRGYAVSALPDTFVVVDGRVVARVGGPRDWSTAAGRRFLTGR